MIKSNFQKSFEGFFNSYYITDKGNLSFKKCSYQIQCQKQQKWKIAISKSLRQINSRRFWLKICSFGPTEDVAGSEKITLQVMIELKIWKVSHARKNREYYIFSNVLWYIFTIFSVDQKTHSVNDRRVSQAVPNDCELSQIAFQCKIGQSRPKTDDFVRGVQWTLTMLFKAQKPYVR